MMRKTMGLSIMFVLLGMQAAHANTHVLILGDSIMQAVARSLEREIGRRDGATAHAYTSIGTGLARMDLFDWHGQMEKLASEQKPAIVIIMMGANDNQPMRVEGDVIRPNEPGWAAEYARRAGEAMDIMIRGGAQKVVWVELPDMRDTRLQADVLMINGLVRQEAAKRPQVTFEESRGLLSRTPGTYSPYIIQANGMPLDIRAGDGIHLNRNGADLLAGHLISRILD